MPRISRICQSAERPASTPTTTSTARAICRLVITRPEPYAQPRTREGTELRSTNGTPARILGARGGRPARLGRPGRVLVPGAQRPARLLDLGERRARADIHDDARRPAAASADRES